MSPAGRRPAGWVLRAISLLAVTVTAAACGGPGDGRPDPASLGTCDAVADAVIDVIQESIDIVDDAADTLGEPDPEVAAAVQEAGAALEARAAALGCSEGQMAEAIAARADRLEARSVYGQLIIEGLSAGDASTSRGE